METRHFKSIGKEISLLGFGLMRLPKLGPDKREIDYAAAEAMLDRALRAGVNYFDTAWPYHEGRSEVFAGRALSRYPRESYHLATKLPVWDVASAADVDRFFNEQLQRCRTEYFDFYLVHSLNKANYRTVQEVGVYELLLKKKEQGLIRQLGFSFHDHADLLERIVSDYAWDFAQIQLNYIDWKAINAERLYGILAERAVPVVIMEPVRGGTLASLTPEAAALLKAAAPGASAASWALRYAASLPGVMTVLSGMSTMEQMEDNLRTMSDFRPLSSDEYALLEKAGALFSAAGAIPCTGCRYCMDCPSGVDIPRVFSAYNHYRSIQAEPHARVLFNADYTSLGQGEQAHNCTACGACLEHCPQALDIPKRLAEVAAFAAPKA